MGPKTAKKFFSPRMELEVVYGLADRFAGAELFYVF